MEKIVKETLSKQIYEILKDDIIHQKITCGTKITLKALQERFGLSSTPIREAIKTLSNEGLINDVTNVGAKVVSFGPNDVREIFDFCCVLDTAALRFAMTRENREAFCEEIRRSIQQQQQALDCKNMEDFKVHSDMFHDLFFRYAENSRLYGASKKLRSQLSILTTLYQSEDIAKSVVFVEHARIAETIVAGNLEEAEQHLKAHIEREQNYLLETLIHQED